MIVVVVEVKVVFFALRLRPLARTRVSKLARARAYMESGQVTFLLLLLLAAAQTFDLSTGSLVRSFARFRGVRKVGRRRVSLFDANKFLTLAGSLVFVLFVLQSEQEEEEEKNLVQVHLFLVTLESFFRSLSLAGKCFTGKRPPREHKFASLARSLACLLAPIVCLCAAALQFFFTRARARAIICGAHLNTIE